MTGAKLKMRVALLLPALWGVVMVYAFADAAAQGDLFITIWFAFGPLVCAAAITVIATTPRPTARRVWLWAIGAIPASFFGPLPLVLLFVTAIRRDLRNALSLSRCNALAAGVGDRLQRAVEEAALKRRPGVAVQPVQSTAPVPAPPAQALEESREPSAAPPAQPPKHSRPAAVPELIAQLFGCIVGGIAIFIGILTLVVLGGAHKISTHDLRVMLLIGALPAASAIVVFTAVWIVRGPSRRRRAAAGLPMGALALIVVSALTAWLWGQG